MLTKLRARGAQGDGGGEPVHGVQSHVLLAAAACVQLLHVSGAWAPGGHDLADGKPLVAVPEVARLDVALEAALPREVHKALLALKDVAARVLEAPVQQAAGGTRERRRARPRRRHCETRAA